MKQVIVKFRIFKFKELSEKAKEKVIQDNYDINTDYDWFDGCYETFHEKLAEIGIKCEGFYWDLDRGSYFYLDKPYCFDERKFLKATGFDLRTKYARQKIDEGIGLDTQHYGGGTGRTYVKEYDDDDRQLQVYLKEVLEGFLSTLRKEYEYLTSEEAIIESIEANDIDFEESGKRFGFHNAIEDLNNFTQEEAIVNE